MIAFGGALLTVLTGILSPRSAARALDWNVLFILAGSVGLGAVVVSSGLADRWPERSDTCPPAACCWSSSCSS